MPDDKIEGDIHTKNNSTEAIEMKKDVCGNTIDSGVEANTKVNEETAPKKVSPFLGAETTDNEESSQALKKESPFLTSEVVEEEKEEESTILKQHGQIDDAVKEKAIFNQIGKLYFLSKKTGKLETRGEGKIMIITDPNGLYKVMMIRDKVMLKGCNHYIAASCPLVKASQVKNSWVWTALNDQSDAEKNDEKTTYFATFKTEEDATKFEEKYNYAMKENVKSLEALKSKRKDEL